MENDKIAIKKLEIEIENTGHITNTYLIVDKKENLCAIIDPAFNSLKILNLVKQLNTKLDKIIITHAHADHIAALADIANENSIPVYVHEYDFNGLYDKKINEEDIVQTKVKKVDEKNVITLKDKDIIKVGSINFEVLHTPGHTKGSICLYNKENDILFSGDTVFKNTYGRTDLITGSSLEMKNSLDYIFNSLDNPLTFPGHGESFYLNDSKRKINLLFAYKG